MNSKFQIFIFYQIHVTIIKNSVLLFIYLFFFDVNIFSKNIFQMRKFFNI